MPSADYAFPALDATVRSTLGTPALMLSDRSQTLINTINTAETNNFQQTINAADDASSKMLAYSNMIERNMSITDIAINMDTENQKLQDGSKETYTRQAEINEWQAQNKLDTLFFLQLLFLFFTLMVGLLFLRRYGIVTTGMLWMIGGLLTLLLVGTLWNRASYTFNSRDPRYWNRRYIGLTDSGLSAKSATCQ